MKIYTRHVLKSFLGLFLLVFVSAVAIFLIIDFVGNSRVWLTRPPAERTIYYLNYLPYIAFLICPIALLLAAVFSVGNLAKHLELVALRSAGVSVTRILMPIFYVGALLSVGMFVLQDRILPDANHRRFQIQEPGPGMFNGSDPRERSNYLYTSENGTLVYFQFYSGQRVTGSMVTALQLKEGRPARRVDAPTVQWKDSVWQFQDGMVREFRGDSVTTRNFSVYHLPGFRDPPEDILDERVYPDEMSQAELGRRIAVLRRTGEPSHGLQTHWHFRIASAMVNLLMAVIGALLAANAVRSGLARNFGIGLLITFLYYVALRLGLVMGENGGLTPWVAAWFGNLIFIPLAIGLWWKAARA
jgi:lipopolysaccharide export system permease protein